MSNTKNYYRLKAMHGMKGMLPNDPAGEAYEQGKLAQDNQKLNMKNQHLAETNIMRAASNKLPKRGPVFTPGTKAERTLNYDALKTACTTHSGMKGGPGSGPQTSEATKPVESNIPKVASSGKAPYTRNFGYLKDKTLVPKKYATVASHEPPGGVEPKEINKEDASFYQQVQNQKEDYKPKPNAP